MKRSFNLVKRFGGVGLEIGLGAFLIVMLLAAWKSSGSEASAAGKHSGKKNKSAATSALLPVQGTMCICPANITVSGGSSCSATSGVVVNYPAPTGTNCAPVTCTPPSGSVFLPGTTVVTCVGGTTCTFTVTVTGTCLQDDSNPGNVVVFNLSTGQYSFCCNGVLIKSGTGKVTQKGCIFTIEHDAPDRRVVIRIDRSVNKGTASVQAPPGTLICTITDKNTTNNSCTCGVAVEQ